MSCISGSLPTDLVQQYDPERRNHDRRVHKQLPSLFEQYGYVQEDPNLVEQSWCGQKKQRTVFSITPREEWLGYMYRANCNNWISSL